MHELQTIHHSSMLRVLIGKLIANTKDYLVVRPLQMLFPRRRYEKKLQLMRSLPYHTVGNDLARMLDAKGLKLIPGFERHDLNHLILGYGMEPEEELCMQAYLVIESTLATAKKRLALNLQPNNNCCLCSSRGSFGN